MEKSFNVVNIMFIILLLTGVIPEIMYIIGWDSRLSIRIGSYFSMIFLISVLMALINFIILIYVLIYDGYSKELRYVVLMLLSFLLYAFIEINSSAEATDRINGISKKNEHKYDSDNIDDIGSPTMITIKKPKELN